MVKYFYGTFNKNRGNTNHNYMTDTSITDTPNSEIPELFAKDLEGYDLETSKGLEEAKRELSESLRTVPMFASMSAITGGMFTAKGVVGLLAQSQRENSKKIQLISSTEAERMDFEKVDAQANIGVGAPALILGIVLAIIAKKSTTRKRLQMALQYVDSVDIEENEPDDEMTDDNESLKQL